VHALALGGLHDGIVEVTRARAQADVEPDLLEPGQLVGGAGRADDACAQCLRGLERGDAHARRDTGDEEPLPGREMALGNQHVVDDDERERRGRRLFPGEALRHAQGLARVHQGELGEAATAPPHRARADRHPGDAVADLHHLARAFAAAGLRGSARRPAQ